MLVWYTRGTQLSYAGVLHTQYTRSEVPIDIHRVPKKTKQICFCQNFVKFPPISIIFGIKMRNDPNICEVHSLSTSPNLRHHLTVLNANVPNCYITPKLLVIDRSHWRPQFIRGRRTFRDNSNFRQCVWSVLREKVYRSKIADIDELKTRLVNEWAQFDHSIIDAAISQWRHCLSACVRARGAHFEHKF